MSVGSWIRGIFGSRSVPVYELGKPEPIGQIVEPLKPFGVVSYSSASGFFPIMTGSMPVESLSPFRYGSYPVSGYGDGIIRASLDLYKPTCAYCGSKNTNDRNNCKNCGAPL